LPNVELGHSAIAAFAARPERATPTPGTNLLENFAIRGLCCRRSSLHESSG
jgi:hypothetical protein